MNIAASYYTVEELETPQAQKDNTRKGNRKTSFKYVKASTKDYRAFKGYYDYWVKSHRLEHDY